MPRPKLLPEARVRSSKACSSCKSSKIKCDSRTPCSACEKRGRVSSCIYRDVDGRRRPGPRSIRPTGEQSMLKSSEPITVPSCNYASPTSIILGSDLSPAASVPARVHNQNGTQAHASTTAEGESNERGTELDIRRKDCITNSSSSVADGETASSSFLLYLRETLRPYVGPIPFTEDKIQDLLLETGMPIEMHGLVEPEADQIYTLAEYYFEAVSTTSLNWIIAKWSCRPAAFYIFSQRTSSKL